MAPRCEEVADALPRILDGSAGPDPVLASHVETCLRCQAELARYRRLLRLLRQLRTETIEPPPGLIGATLRTIESAAERRAIRSALSGRRLAYAGGLGAALAAGTGVVVVTHRRTLRRRPAEPERAQAG